MNFRATISSFSRRNGITSQMSRSYPIQPGTHHFYQYSVPNGTLTNNYDSLDYRINEYGWDRWLRWFNTNTNVRATLAIAQNTNTNVWTTHTKSRRDDTLLTVDFNLQTRDDAYSLQVPQGRHFENIINLKK